MKIQNKLIIIISCIVAVVVIFTTYISLSLYGNMVKTHQENYFSALLRVFAYTCKTDINKFVEALEYDREVVMFAMVLATDGSVIVESAIHDKTPPKLKIDLNTLSADSPRYTSLKWDGEEGVEATIPVIDNDKPIYFVRIGFSTSKLIEEIQDAKKNIIMIAFVAMFFGVSMAYIFSSKIVRPIVSLTNKAELIALGRRDVTFNSPVIAYPQCHTILKCTKTDCDAHENGREISCWHTNIESCSFDKSCNQCKTCPVYKIFMKNEVNRLVETFKIMYESIIKNENELMLEEAKLTNLNQELQNTLKSLTESKAKYKTLTESARDIIFTLDLQGRLTFINHRAKEILGVDARPLYSGKTFTKLLDQKSRKKAYKVFEEIILGEEPQPFEVIAMAKTDGVTLELILSPIHEKGNIVGIHGVARDISYRKLLESQLIQTGKLSSIGELVTGIAHELNQPLMIIRGFSQLIGSSLKENDENYKELKFIETQTGRMVKIISHLKAFARQAQPEFEAVDINNVIENSLLMTSEHLKNKNIAVVKKYANDIPMINGDASQLEQVLLNLITNAKDAMKKLGGGVLEFRTSFTNDRKVVRVDVSDTGSGISEKHLTEIFDPFFTTKEVGRGTGLGLSISYGIIQTHHGDITVKSKLDEGTTFTIELPVREEENGKNEA